jgi:hypothetical protein
MKEHQNRHNHTTEAPVEPGYPEHPEVRGPAHSRPDTPMMP